MMTLVLALVPFMGISAKKKTVQQSDRQYWCSLAYKMAQPVLENMAKGELQKNMQTEFQSQLRQPQQKGALYGVLRQTDGWCGSMAHPSG